MNILRQMVGVYSSAFYGGFLPFPTITSFPRGSECERLIHTPCECSEPRLTWFVPHSFSWQRGSLNVVHQCVFSMSSRHQLGGILL